MITPLNPERAAMRLLRFATLAAVLASAAGCGSKAPKLVPMTGKVVHKGDPMTAGSVYFHATGGNATPTQDPPSSVLQTDGSFTVKTYPFGEGIPPGDYKVTVSGAVAGRARLPKYSDPTKTPWMLNVPEAGVQDQVFEMK